MAVNISTWSDIDLRFTRNIYDDITKLTDADAVRQSVVNLVMTILGVEYLFHPEIGTDINGLLFENYDLPIMQNLFENRIRDCIRNYEKRVEDLSVKVQENLDLNEIQIDIYFSIASGGEIYEANIILEKVR